MSRVGLLARRERAEFADMLESLGAEQWHQPSLCVGWTVRDVVAHTVAYLGQSRSRFAINMALARGDVDRLNRRALEHLKSMQPAQLVDLMRCEMEPTGVGGLYGGRVALIECLVHQQDVRRPLGLARVIPEDHLRVSLNFARISPVIAGG